MSRNALEPLGAIGLDRGDDDVGPARINTAFRLQRLVDNGYRIAGDPLTTAPRGYRSDIGISNCFG